MRARDLSLYLPGRLPRLNLLKVIAVDGAQGFDLVQVYFTVVGRAEYGGG